MATLLTCKNLSKHYGSRDLFVDLSIGFDEDQHVGLLGPNDVLNQAHRIS